MDEIKKDGRGGARIAGPGKKIGRPKKEPTTHVRVPVSRKEEIQEYLRLVPPHRAAQVREYAISLIGQSLEPKVESAWVRALRYLAGKLPALKKIPPFKKYA